MGPSLALVSFGENSYGHPTADALCRVQQSGALVYATHRVGNLVARTDGVGITVSPSAPEMQDYCVAGASYWG
jgi:beta-lactamase superfamily II metal-dependent hydrolase